ncbi:MAG TPA: hypothetical protein VJV39_10360 [Dongiaceae bacterium]|nr:hypothetical protein [Dongiaceae bacterium]
MNAPRPQTIPVFLLVKSAFQILWQQRDDALRLGFVPTLICFGGFLYGEDAMIAIVKQWQSGAIGPAPTGVSLTMFMMLLIIFVGMLLAIGNWLRFMLLGPMGAVGLGLAIRRPHIMFLVACVVLEFVGSIALSVMSMPLGALPGALALVGFLVAVILVTVALVRMLPFAVGQVIAQPMSLQEAWRSSRGNGIPLAIALVLVQVPIWIITSVLNRVLFAIGFADVAPLAMVFIVSAFATLIAILQATVLAAAFRQMVGIRA